MYYLPLPRRFNLKFTLCFIALVTWGISCFTYASDKNPATAWQKIQSGALIIDVRTPEEFNQGHLPNAINIPHQQILSGINNYNIKKDTSIVVYCRSGHRSGIANNMLIKNGYSNTYNGGGYNMLMESKQG